MSTREPRASPDRSEQEREALLARERAVRERLERLQVVTAALSAAATAEEVAAVILWEGRTALGAFAGIVWELEPTDLVLLHAEGYTPEFATRWRRVPLDAPVPVADSARTGAPVWIASRADMVARYPLLAEPGARIPSEASNALPLVVGERVLGVIGFSFAAPRSWTREDQDFALVLAEQCALALERARLADAEREARDRAEAAVRLRDETLAAIAHDLKGPLAVIRGQAQFLHRLAERERGLTADRLLPHLTTINAAALRALAQTEEIVDLARSEARAGVALDRRLVDLVALVRAVATEHQALTGEHRIVVEAPADELWGVWDARRLERAIGSLVENAIKFSPGGGEVTVAVTREARPAGPGVVVSVRDQGLGIPAADVARVFERYARGGNVGRIPGSGIGLASARWIAEAHGGSIQVASAEGVGSTFRLFLPLDRGAP